MRRPRRYVSLFRPIGTPRAWLSAVVFATFVAGAPLSPVRAVQPDEILADPALEARARHISGGLRCLVCQNQSIDDSNAPLARDLRLLVRERLRSGDSDQAVMSYVVRRYGDFVLLRPPLNAETVLLWVAPLLLLIGAAVFARRQFRRAASASLPTATSAEAPLSPEESQRLDRILNRDG
ncbi:MAG: cytochrome c-type biogenesis protein CcmH [Hyphomicrobiaceae bacterium]